MKARVKWVEQRTFAGESDSGHLVMMDGAPESGGRNLAARPMELLLLGMGGCSAFDVVMILEKAREKITDCVVEMEAVRADIDPKVFTKIDLHFIVTGNNLKQEKVERAVNLSAEKYCSASLMLGKTAEITHRVTVIND